MGVICSGGGCVNTGNVHLNEVPNQLYLVCICNYESIVNSLKVGESEEGVCGVWVIVCPVLHGAIGVLQSEDIQVRNV